MKQTERKQADRTVRKAKGRQAESKKTGR
jgi:hypothetical protein